MTPRMRSKQALANVNKYVEGTRFNDGGLTCRFCHSRWAIVNDKTTKAALAKTYTAAQYVLYLMSTNTSTTSLQRLGFLSWEPWPASSTRRLHSALPSLTMSASSTNRGTATKNTTLIAHIWLCRPFPMAEATWPEFGQVGGYLGRYQ